MSDRPPSSTDRELASLKQEFDDLRETVSELRAERKENTQQLYQTLRGLGLSGEEIEANVRGLMDHGLTRRAAMLAVVGAVGGAGFMSGRVSAAASTSDSDGDVGTPSNRVDVFADGVDANSVTTDGLAVTKPPAGTDKQVLDATNAGDEGAYLQNNEVDSVSTSATTILSPLASNAGLWIIVIGRAGVGTLFVDYITMSNDDGSITIQHSETEGSPAGRTYSRSSGGVLQLAMASGTYNVMTTALVSAVGG